MILWYHRLRRLKGYHFGVLCCAFVAAVVLIINLILTIWAVSSSGVQNGLGTLQDGSCKRTATLTFWIHLAINILSTLLLGASNYSMQCLSSPTRSEIDKAHGKGVWLDIGVPGVRNLRHLSMARVTLWWLLAISSIPLHLLYNSAVFSTSCSNRYNAYLVSDDFLRGAPFYFPNEAYYNGMYEINTYGPFLKDYQKNQTSLERLDVRTCVEIYTAPIISSHSDVLLISTYSNLSNSSLNCPDGIINGSISNVPNDVKFCQIYQQGDINYSYSDTTNSLLFVYDLRGRLFDNGSLNLLECSNVVACNLPFANLTDPQNWLQYCLSVPGEEHCTLQFSLVIMIVVIVCNLIKTACMSTIAWKKDPEPLVTLGDAIASFLDRPDGTTKGNCIAEKARFKKSKSWDSLSRPWASVSLLLFRAASSRRWIVCNIL